MFLLSFIKNYLVLKVDTTIYHQISLATFTEIYKWQLIVLHSFIITYFIFFQQLYFLTFDSSLLLRKKIWWLQRDIYKRYDYSYERFLLQYYPYDRTHHFSTHTVYYWNEKVFQTYKFMSFLRLVVHNNLKGVSFVIVK